MGISLLELDDRELLFRMDDVADNEGLVTSEELADAFGLKGVEIRNVSARLVWLKRYGVVSNRTIERLNVETNRKVKIKAWYITEEGERYVFNRLNARQRQSLENMPDETLVETVAIMGARYQATSAVARNLLRRQWRAGTFVPNGRRRRR